jgi:hypothetical protein
MSEEKKKGYEFITEVERIQGMNVFQRIHAVMSDVGTIQKKGFNAHFKYAYAKEADFVEAIRPLLDKYRLAITPNVDTFMFSPNNDKMVNIKVTYTIINIDNPADRTTASMIGQGHDNSDKAIPKSLASTRKYFLASTFMIATGDDPEADNVDVAGKKPEAKKDAPPVTSSFRRKEAVALAPANDDDGF